MSNISRIKSDEKGVMVFALIGVVIILLSVAATAYLVEVKRQSQRGVIDTAVVDETEREIEKVKAELESAAFEAGQQAVKKVRQRFSKTSNFRSMSVLKKRVSENTTEIFEKYFEKHYGSTVKKGGREFTFHLRPLEKGHRGIEFKTLYLKEQRGTRSVWDEIPGFFKIEREVRVNILDKSSGTFSTRKFTVDRQVKTDLFILADRLQRFDIENMRKMTDCMLFAYLNTKVYDAGFKKDIAFEKTFGDTFRAGWLEEYDEGEDDFEYGEDRKKPYTVNSSRFIAGFERDRGNLSTGSILSKDEVRYTAKLSLLIEQIRAFRSYDDDLLREISDYFSITGSRILELIGSGRKNKLNIQNLIIRLFVEKGTLSENVFYPGLFLRSITEHGILSLVEKGRTETSFGLIKNLVQGRVLDGDRWLYSELSDRTRSIRKLKTNRSYTRALFSLYSNTMEEVLMSFKSDPRGLKEFVLDEIRSNETLTSMGKVSIIGKSGTKKIARSIVHTAKNLSRSFGFKESSSTNTGYLFYYFYFLNNWGLEGTGTDKIDPTEKLDFEGVPAIVESRIVNELDTRKINLDDQVDYDKVQRYIREYNRTEWYDGSQVQKAAWADLNESLSPLENISNNDMFDRESEDNTSRSLKDHYPELKDDIEKIQDHLSSLGGQVRAYTRDIIEIETNFTEKKWQYEAYDFLIEQSEEIADHNTYFHLVDDYLTAPSEDLSGSYGWSLKDLELAKYIEMPPEEPDQSVGYETVGMFTEEVIRGFKRPLDYNNPSRFFALINRNLYDLKEARGVESESRLFNILEGDGDPFSESLEKEDISTAAVDITGKKIHSNDIDKINGWWTNRTFSRSVDRMKDIRRVLREKARELEKKSIHKQPYKSYSDASFYRTANRFIAPIIAQMEKQVGKISRDSRRTGYTYRIGGKEEKIPVVSAPRGDLTITDAKAEEKRTFSYSLDLELNMDHGGELIEVRGFHTAAKRNYNGDISHVQEWVNPFADGYSDHYGSAFFSEYITSSFDLRVSTGSENILSSKRYSSSGLIRQYRTRRHLAFAETCTPIPLVERTYTPDSPPSVNINSVSIDRNVFNGSKNTASISIETGNSAGEKGIFLQLIKKDGLSRTSDLWRRELNHDYNIREEKSKDRTVLFQKKIAPEDLKDGRTELTFDMSGVDFSGARKSTFMIRIKPQTEIAWMKDSLSMEQSVDPKKDKGLYSNVPQYADSEQLYIFPEDHSSNLGVFRWSQRPSNQNRFDFIQDIPDDSWVVEKRGVHYLLDFSEDENFRDSLSGRYESGTPERYSDFPFVAPSYEVGDILPFSSSFLPDNEYRSLLKTELIPLYMSPSEHGEDLLPERMVPLPVLKHIENWNSIHEMLRSNNNPIEVETDGSESIWYRPGYYCGKERVDHTYRYARSQIEKNKIDHVSHLSANIESGTRTLREVGRIEEFKNSKPQKRESLFLAASHAEGEMHAVKGLERKYQSFTLGDIAKSVDILDKEKTEELLQWLKKERSFHNSELEAFLSFKEDFIRNLERRTDSSSYQEALTNIDQRFDGMRFTGYRERGIKNKDDIAALNYLRALLSKNAIMEAASYGLRPSTLEKMNRSSHRVDINKFVDLLDRLSTSHYFDDFIEELNNDDYSHLSSVYLAGRDTGKKIEWMPFGDKGAPLLIEDRAGYYNLSSSKGLDDIKRFIDFSIKDASEQLDSQRAGLILDLRQTSIDKAQIKELESYVEKRTTHHSPSFKKIGLVEIRIEGDMKFRYLHL